MKMPDWLRGIVSPSVSKPAIRHIAPDTVKDAQIRLMEADIRSELADSVSLANRTLRASNQIRDLATTALARF